MTANKSSKAVPRAGGVKAPRDIPDRCQSTSPCPVLAASQGPGQQPLLGDGEKQSRYVRTDGRFLVRTGWKTATLGSAASLKGDAEFQGRLIKSKSISCLDNRLSIYKPPGQTKSCQEGQEQKEQKGELYPEDGYYGRPLSCSTLSLGPSTNQNHKRTLSLTRTVAGVPPRHNTEKDLSMGVQEGESA
ncbi:hypothetical protein CgunFtcFv8_020692 [Champsocephalus gunnari]|uniref:Uncharacterized protein n=1 Tax=Champsocephalus gunnari TaxID=52237 RepID=A0AAN8E526_CHAGU|nr:hypothetical protein CgunFtcFv8_020692 [Champsocephalus gunnari]